MREETSRSTAPVQRTFNRQAPARPAPPRTKSRQGYAQSTAPANQGAVASATLNVLQKL